MTRLLVLLLFVLPSTPIFAEAKVEDYKKLEKCLNNFYKGRPRDYPPKSEKKEILIFESVDGKEYLHTKQLRGMEVVCYKMFTSNK